MNYTEAEKMKNDNLHIIGEFSKLKGFPYYIRWLIIVPSNVEFKERMAIFTLAIENGYNNKKAIEDLGYADKDLAIMIMGYFNGIYQEFSLLEYLKRIHSNID